MALRGGSWAEVVLIVVLVVVMVVPAVAPGSLAKGLIAATSPAALPIVPGEQSARQQNSVAQSSSCTIPPCVVTTIPVGSNPVGMAYDSAHGEVYVANQGAGTIDVISTATDAILTSVSDPGSPLGVAYDSGKGEVFVSNYGSGTVSIVNDTLNTISQTISVGGHPASLVYDRSKGEIFEENYDQSTAIINDTNNSVVHSFSFGQCGGAPSSGDVQYDSYAGEVFVYDCADNLNVINDTNDSVVTQVYVSSGGAVGTVFDSERNEVYLSFNNVVAVVSASSNSVVTTFSLQPSYSLDEMTYDPEMGDIYISADDTSTGSSWNNVTVISDSTNTVVATVPVAWGPSGEVYVNGLGEVMVASHGGTSTGGRPVVTVLSPLSFQATPATIDLGSATTLTVTPLNGSPSLSYNFTGLPSGCSTVNRSTFSCIPATTGTFALYAYANTSTGTATRLTTLVVNPGLSISSFTASPSVVDAGNSTIFSVSPSGGTPPYSYTYTGLPPGCASANNASFACAPSTAGSYIIRVSTTDSLGGATNATLNLTVNPALAITSFTASPQKVTLGRSLNFSVSVSGGSSPYGYSYLGLPLGCPSSNVSSFSCMPATTGMFNVTVLVTDLTGANRSGLVPVAIYAVPTVSIHTQRTEVDVNESLLIQTNVTGGDAPFVYRYTTSSPSSGCNASRTSQLVCTPTSTGSFTVTVNVTDSLGAYALATSTTITVDTALHSALNVSTTTPLLGQTIAFVANTSGGRAPYSYSYLGLPYGCYSENKPSVGCLPTQSDWYNVTVVVTDLNNGSARSTVGMHVIFDFNVVIPASTPAGQQLTIMVNTNETFNGTAINKSALFAPDGGYGIFTYNYSGLPPGCVNKDVATLTCTPTTAGNYTVTISVHDQAGDHQTHSVVVRIVGSTSSTTPPSKSSKPGFLGLPGYDGYIIIGAVVVAVAAVVALLLMRKRSPPTPAKATPKDEVEPDKEAEKGEAEKAPSPEPEKTE